MKRMQAFLLVWMLLLVESDRENIYFHKVSKIQ
jgi:hypothetical protein